ncbi:MAG: carboxypeptidase-like regulatory domain-containing protein [Cyclobacteriaceae bacterium]|nr:carboxypeptidase-like regulatory domain-containing protein [Cyclobacteriaceae bacterium]
MQKKLVRYLAGLLLLLGVGTTQAQKIYRGIVVDSASMVNLQGVHITVKSTSRGVASNSAGGFLVSARPIDTLIFTAIGYHTLELPLMFEEDALFILLRENTIMLNEVTIKSNRLYPNKIEDHTKTAPRTMAKGQKFSSPFDYFWKLEREKRKLTRVIEENNRTQTFRQVITDPDVKKIMMEDHHIEEETYYHLVEKFNMQHPAVHYFTDPDAIMEALHGFFEKNIPAR